MPGRGRLPVITAIRVVAVIRVRSPMDTNDDETNRGDVHTQYARAKNEELLFFYFCKISDTVEKTYWKGGIAE